MDGRSFLTKSAVAARKDQLIARQLADFRVRRQTEPVPQQLAYEQTHTINRRGSRGCLCVDLESIRPDPAGTTLDLKFLQVVGVSNQIDECRAGSDESIGR
jgi:hypothetical protein